MEKSLTYIHKINGVIQEREKLLKWFNKFLDTCPNGDMLMEFVSAPRTNAQNAYYWVVLGNGANRLGTTPEELHEYFKEKHLPTEEYFVVIKRKKQDSTTKLNTDEMGTYIDNVIHDLAENGVVVPDLEEYKHTH